MARTTPLVDDTRLHPGQDAEAIPVGTPAWYTWLEAATTFAFVGAKGTFTAYKERRGHTTGYWKAYRKRAGSLHRAYLGKSADLTLDRLNAVATELAQRVGVHVPNTYITTAETLLNTAGAPEDIPASGAALDIQRTRPNAPDVAALRRHNHTAAPTSAHRLPLLPTKLAIPPMRANIVPRPRLVTQLDAALAGGCKLTLISAPAGSGKTTLLVEWLNALRLETRDLRLVPESHVQASSLKPLVPRVAWLTLDGDDNQLDRFLAYLLTALERVRPRISAGAYELLGAADIPLSGRLILTALLHALATSMERLVLVLDDYHAITLPAIHEALIFLLDHMPPSMHIIVASRVDPPLPLARLRVQGQLTELRAADLSLTPAEATSFFDRVAGLHLSGDAVTALAARTEGWVAGLQLAALSLQEQDVTQRPAFIVDFTGDHRYIWDYLIEEVFQHQPRPIQQFLLQTAILSRLCGPLCDAVTGQPDGQAMLERLEHANLFLVELDTARRWYRYHHLFVAFLRARLAREVKPAGRAELHRRASAWYAQNNLIVEAIDHALSAQDWEHVAQLMVPLMAPHQFHDYQLDWPRWLAALPDAMLQAHPDFALRYAWILLFVGHIEAYDRPLRLIETIWDAAGDQTRLGEILSVRGMAAWFARNVPYARQFAQAALDRLPPQMVEPRGIALFTLGASELFLGNVVAAQESLVVAHEALHNTVETLFPTAIASAQAYAHYLQGRLRRAGQEYMEVIRRAGDQRHRQIPPVHISLGKLHYEWNDIAAAEHALRQAIVVGQQTGRGQLWPVAYSALARVLCAKGDRVQASHASEQAISIARWLGQPRAIADAEAYRARLWLALGDLASAEQWRAECGLSVNDAFVYERQIAHLTLVRVHLARERQTRGNGQLSRVLQLLDRLLEAAEAAGRWYDVIEILALTALAHVAQHDLARAVETLARALGQAEPEGYVRTFADEGAAMAELLARPDVRATAPDYVTRLLRACGGPVPQSEGPDTGSATALLSGREIDVLRLLASGHSAEEIARTLIISVQTTRTHIKHIYAKLEAHSRLQAVERARALNIV